jgi:hypothetical protein
MEYFEMKYVCTMGKARTVLRNVGLIYEQRIPGWQEHEFKAYPDRKNLYTFIGCKSCALSISHGITKSRQFIFDFGGRDFVDSVEL